MNKQRDVQAKNEDLHKQLALKITLQFIGFVTAFEVAYILFNLLLLVIAGATNFDQTTIFKVLKPYFVPVMIVVSLVGIGCISYRFMLQPLEHLKEIAQAAQKLAHPTEAPIVLSTDLKSIEDDMNQVRIQALQNLKDIQSVNKRKDDLLIYLAHDLKTPLTSVIGYLELLEDEPDITPELASKYIGIAKKKAFRLEELINEFFEITRFSTTKLSLELSKINLSRMLKQITYEFNPILTEKGLTWDLQIAENVEISCDATKLERAIDNLIRNAVNYCYPNTIIHFSLKKTNDSVQICVQNKGQTIAKEKLERIFEQFYRLDTARSSDTGGAGLGLAIAKEIIELHQGTITAYSENENIRFVIQLPIDSQKIVRN